MSSAGSTCARRPTHRRPSTREECTLRALPDAQNFPVLVGTRLSLGVPLLFTAVPVYNVDLTRRNHRDFAETIRIL